MALVPIGVSLWGTLVFPSLTLQWSSRERFLPSPLVMSWCPCSFMFSHVSSHQHYKDTYSDGIWCVMTHLRCQSYHERSNRFEYRSAGDNIATVGATEMNVKIGTLVPPRHIVFGLRNNHVSRPDEGGQGDLLRCYHISFVNYLMLIASWFYTDDSTTAT